MKKKINDHHLHYHNNIVILSHTFLITTFYSLNYLNFISSIILYNNDDYVLKYIITFLFPVFVIYVNR